MRVVNGGNPFEKKRENEGDALKGVQDVRVEVLETRFDNSDAAVVQPRASVTSTGH